jgi:peptide/nickel transport system substrate-binding protein
VVLRIIPDPSARVAAFEKGEVDMIYFNALPFSEAPRLAKLPGVTLQKTNLRGAAFIGIFNLRNKPYSDVRVRQAIAHAIDRGFIRDNVDTGFTIKMLGPVPPASPLYDSDLKDYDFDPKIANDLLDAAGYPRNADGIRFAFNFLWPSTDAGTTRMAEIIRENLKAVGIEAKLQPLERAALQQKGYVALRFDMLCETYGLGPDPDIGVEPLYNSKGIQNPPVPYLNPSGYSNPEVDRLFEEQRVLVDLPKRKEVYARIQKLIWDDVPVLPMFSYEGPNIYRSSVVSGVFQGSYGSQDSFVTAAPVAATTAPTPVASAGGETGWIEVGGGVVVAAAAVAVVLRRRRRGDDFEGS